MLGERIQELLENYGTRFLQLFVPDKNAKEFSKYIIDLRNYYTHPKEKKIIAPKERELDKLNEKLELLFFILLFNRVRMSPEKINEIITRHKFTYLR